MAKKTESGAIGAGVVGAMLDLSLNPVIHIRSFLTEDVEVVARLHADSWRSAYRGILRDEYLDGPILEERRQLWRGRFDKPVVGQIGLLAISAGVPAGFAFALPAQHPRWGTLLDNLHVASGERGGGIGTRLLHALASELIKSGHESGFHLWVFEENRRTRTYYERLGAVGVERSEEPTPDGGTAAAWLYAWPTVHSLRAATRV